MTRIFVTGGSGFIGSHLVAKLLDLGYNVTNYDIVPSAFNPEAKHIIGDIMDFDNLCEAMQEHKYVCHLAAMLGVVACQARPEEVHRINYIGTENVLKACSRNNVDNVLFASSSEVYGEAGLNMLLTEESPLIPISPYGKAKMEAESLVKQYHLQYNKKSTVIRYCNVYGPRQRVDFVIPIFINNMLQNKPIPVCDQGQQVRVYTYIDDAINGTIQALLNTKIEYQTFNICSNDTLSVLEVAKKILDLRKGTSTIEFLEYSKVNRMEKYEIIYRVPSNKKASTLLGFSPTVSIDKGLELTCNYYEKIKKRE